MKSNRWQDLKDIVDVNRKLVLAVSLCLLGATLMQRYVSAPDIEMLGIADSKETAISFETPVIVKRVFVLPGQKVRKGQPLLEVEQSEVNLKLAELRTLIESLKSERSLRDNLISSLSQGENRRNDNDNAMRRVVTLQSSPIDEEILGLQKQIDQLKKQQELAIRYTKLDGVVASVNFRPNEHVAPFQPIMTLTTTVPSLVYGFVNEKRISDIQIGDVVKIESASGSSQSIHGQIISLGSRITMFPERLQASVGVRYWGREVVVSIPDSNQFLMGEKVLIKSGFGSSSIEVGGSAAHAFGSTVGGLPTYSLTPIARGLKLEASGLTLLSESKTLLLVSDENGPEKSPIWSVSLTQPESPPINIRWKGGKSVEDVESITQSGRNLFAMSSLGPTKSGELKPERNNLVRFSLQGEKFEIDRQIDFRALLLEFLQTSPIAGSFDEPLDQLEVEGFSILNGEGFLSLKQPLANGGYSVIIRTPDIVDLMEKSQMNALSPEVYTLVQLQDKRCSKPSRISDLLKTDSGLLILSVCRKKENVSQIWWLGDQDLPHQAKLLASIPNTRFEGMALAEEAGYVYLSSDRGEKHGSDLVKIQLPALP